MRFFYYRNLADLSQFGIETLTGEACSLGIRTLCDLTATGVGVVEETLGLLPQRAVPSGQKTMRQSVKYPGFKENWNGGTKDAPHVASFMMPHELARPLAIAGMFRVHQCDAVATYSDPVGSSCRSIYSLIGIKLEDGETREDLQKYDDEHRPFGHFQGFIMPGCGPHIGLSNVNAASSRNA